MNTQSPFKAIAQRIVNAEETFAGVIAQIAGCDMETAHKIRAVYAENGLLNQDAVLGRITVKHGALLDEEVVLRMVSEVS